MSITFIFNRLINTKQSKPAVLRNISLTLLIIPVSAILFSTRIYATQIPEEPLIGFTGFVTSLPNRNLFFIYGKNGTGYIDNRGKAVLKPIYSLSGGVFYDGWDCLADKNLDKNYLFHKSGKKLIRVPGKSSGIFSDGMLSFDDGVYGSRLEGFIDNTGEVAIPPIFGTVKQFGEGLAAAKLPGGKYGFIDKKGKFVIKPAFDDVDVFSDGLAAMLLPGACCSYIDRSGKQAIQASYKHCFRFSDGVARVMTHEGKWAYINHSGKVISESASPDAADDELFSEGLSAVMLPDKKFGYINTKGKFVIPPRFTYALPFYDGLALVCDDNGLWGYIDKTGNYVIAPRFCHPNSPEHGFFSEGLAFACDPKTEKYGYIDKSGKWVIRPRFDACEEPSGYNCRFSGGLAWVSTDTERQSGGHYHYINRKGKYVWSYPRGAKRSDKGYEQFKKLIKPLTQ